KLDYNQRSGAQAPGGGCPFGEQLGHAVIQAGLEEQPMALMLIALDGLDAVARSLGSEGTAAVMASTQRTVEAVVAGEGDVARLGFGELGLLLRTRDRGALVAMAKQLELLLREPIAFGDENATVVPRIGVTVFPESGRAAESLLRGARSALLRAGAKDQARFEFFLPNAKLGLRQGHDRILESLRAQRIHEELVLHYQPQVNIQDNETVALEALLRWRFSDDQLLGPDGFISMLNDASTAVHVGGWVVRTACEQAMSWQAESGASQRVAVNLSGAQYGDPRLTGLVAKALEVSGLEPELLELEISEQTLMASATETERVLKSLKQLGVRVAIDDFGTGYASLGFLRRFAIDTIKIDRSFVRAIERGGQGGTVARGIIELGHKLDLQVVAVGVETRNQLNFLIREGCDVIQGYLTGAPVEVWLPAPTRL
ncbi:MAG: putative signal transduction protein with EAL and GGDEF domain, partial [Myxococcota bacterium]